MVLKEEIVDLGDIKIKIREMSFESQMKLENLGEKRTAFDAYKECVEDTVALSKINTEQGLKLMRAINEINGWKREEEKDFQKSHS